MKSHCKHIEADQARLLSMLSNTQYEVKQRKLRRRRLPGTGSWLAENDYFKDWMSSEVSSCLCCSGICVSTSVFRYFAHTRLTVVICSWIRKNNIYVRLESVTDHNRLTIRVQ